MQIVSLGDKLQTCMMSKSIFWEKQFKMSSAEIFPQHAKH